MTGVARGAPPGYGEWLAELKDTIRQARLRTSLAVNAELIGLYWRRLLGAAPHSPTVQVLFRRSDAVRGDRRP